MGDIADDLYDQMMDDLYNDRHDFYTPSRLYRPRTIACQFCGAQNLRWHPQQKRVLVDSKGSIHDCRAKPVSADEFPDLEQEMKNEPPKSS